LKQAVSIPAFDPRGDLVSEIDFSLVKKDPTEARRLLFATIQHLRELPVGPGGGTWHHVALRKLHHTRRIMSTRESMPTDPKAPDPGAGGLFTAITPGYFDAIGVRILRGRDFTQAEAENKDAPRVVILDEEMRRKSFRTRMRSVSTFVTHNRRGTVRLTTSKLLAS